jgi:2-polyprenyl-3-methyl-5-hydroxy-6-metoxy-1,4-benzoquinol methylase
MANEFPQAWFDTFLAPENAAPVHRELDFIQAHLPASRFPRLLDVPCGIGRHAGPLAALGYEVLGIDRSEAALSVAGSLHPKVEFRRLDMLALGAF